jgi:hypothetical protein
MFQRTLSSLGQVVRWRKTEPTKLLEEHSERRIWVRYPCDVEATCQPADHLDGMRLSARVRNVSRGGINLVVDAPVQAGSLLSVELPGATPACSSVVLGYVVRVTQGSDGDWSVGCTFATELHDEDLEPFGARRIRHEPRDQRQWVRFPCNVQASYQLVKDPDPQVHSARVANISANGIALLSDRTVELGRLLSLELRSAGGHFTLKILACVVRLNSQGGDWTVGCNLIRELSELELKALL